MTDAVPRVPLDASASWLPKPWIAGVLSVLLPGLGQFYGGRLKRGLGVFGLVIVADVLVLIIGVRLPPRLQLPVMVTGLLLTIAAAAIDAARVAVSVGARRQEYRYNRWYVYAGLIIAFALIVNPALVRWVRTDIVDTFRYASGAMQPTLQEGDYVFAIPTTEIRRGGVIVHERNGQSFLHRAVGLPGDTIQMRAGTLSINGTPYSEPYAQPIRVDEDVQLPEAKWQRRYLLGPIDTATYAPTTGAWGPIVVPPASYFVLGDNRGESLDSRAFGFIPAGSIRARATSIYFSRDPDRGIRWSRVGVPIH